MSSPTLAPGGRNDSASAHSIGSVAFWSFLITQFLGAFNDNYFKQMVLLSCVSQAAKASSQSPPDRQPVALAAFAIPFVLLSGLGGYLSDRCSKQRVIMGCKFAEVGIMGAGLLVLLTEGLSADARLLWLIGVLFLMGAHSAIFAPSKYGVLPELFREDQLLPVNGAVQMTTFLAIIFGTACAGVALDQMENWMWVGSVIAIGIAAAGTFASLFIPRTRIAEPGLILKWENLFLPREVVQLIFRERGLFLAIVVAAVFWFLGGVTQMAVNTLGKGTFELSDTRTSLMVAGIGFGIMAGCIVAGFIGKGQSGPRWVRLGSWLLFVSLLLLACLGSGMAGSASNAKRIDETILGSLLDADRLEWGLRLNMIFLGISAGLLIVPVQVYLQQAPPSEFKGRLLGVQNLVTWIGILLAAAFVGIMGIILRRLAGPGGEVTYQWVIFGILALMVLPVCVFYRLPEIRRQDV